MSGREKVGLQSKSSNSKKDEKNLEEKKERDSNNKTRSQVKVNRNLIRVRKIGQNNPTADCDKSQTKNKAKPAGSRRKNSTSLDQTSVIRKTRQTDDLLELNSELIKRSPTVIDRLISKNKSAIKKSQQKQGKGMPEKSVREDLGEDTDSKAADQLESDSQAGRRLKSNKPASYNVKRKKIDAGKLLANSLARKKLKASQACIEMSAKKRLLRSNVTAKGDKNSLFNLDQKRKLNKGVKILRRKAPVSTEDASKKRLMRKCTLVGDANKLKVVDVKNVAGPSSLESVVDENVILNRVELKSRGGKILQTINPLVRPLKKFPVNSVGLGVNRWKVGLQSNGRGRGRGRGRGGRLLRGRGRGFLHKRTPYLTRSDSPVPLLRNGKRRNCDSTDDTIECVKRRRRNISNEFSKSESLPDDQVSCANDSEFSFCDSVSTVVKGENFDIDDVKIKTEILSPNHKEVSSDKMDSNCNLFDTNPDEKLNAKNFNSVKLTVSSPSEIKAESVESNINIETKGCDLKDSKLKICDTSIGTMNSSVSSDSKIKVKSCRSLSLESKSDCNLEDSSDCDISGDKSVSNALKIRKKSDISERKKISRSLWVRRSLRGVQKNADSDDLSEILKLTESEEIKPDSDPSDVLSSLESDDNKKLPDERLSSNDFDADFDFCLQIEDSPLKTDNKEIKVDNSSCKKCINKEEGSIEQKILDHEDDKEVKELPCKPDQIDLICESNGIESTEIKLVEPSGKPSDPSDQLKELIDENAEKEIRLMNDKTPPSLMLDDLPDVTAEPVVNSDSVKSSNFSKNEGIGLQSESNTTTTSSTINNNNNENTNVAKTVLLLDDNKAAVADDDVTILDFSDEIIKIGDEDISDKDVESTSNFSDKNNDIEITFFKTKDLVEKDKINEIIESLEGCDEMDEETDRTDVVCCNPGTEINKSPSPTLIAKDTCRDNVIEITENESSDVIPVNGADLSSTVEESVCKNVDDNSTLTSVLLDDSNSKDNMAEDKEFNSTEKSNDDVNLNFSDQSSTSSSYTSAVTELPTSVDSDALEIGDNLSNNDWSDKNFDITENITDNSLPNDSMNNIDNKIIENEGNKVFGSVNLDSSSVITLDDSENRSVADKFYESERLDSDSAFIKKNPDADVTVTDDSTIKEDSFNSLMNDENKIMETPEERANKESILSALGLQSLHNSCNEKSKKPDSNYTGTLKAVIKLNRGAGDKKSGGRKMFFKQYDLNSEKDVAAGGDTLEYKIYSEHDESSENGQGDCGAHRKSHMKQRTVSLDETSNSSISAFTSTPVDSLASSEGAKDDKGVVKQSNLVIPEKSSSFSIHPGRLCSDICSYCFGKFGSLDTPCHLAQLKNAERQQKILANESHLKMDSCLCDGCYRYVDRKANCPQALQRSKKRRSMPNAVCSVQNCMQQAQHSIRRKWLIKLKKSISKKLDIDMDKNPHLPFPLCNQHYYWVDYFTVCGICKKRLTRNHMYALGPEANDLNMALKKDGIPIRLSDKLFLCKLCRYYSSLRIKYKDTSVLNTSHKLFLRSYKKKILAYLDIPVSESEGEAEKSSQEDESNSVQDLMKSKKRKSKQIMHEGKKRKTLDGKPESCDSVDNSDEPQMIDYSYLDTLKINVGSNKKTGESSSESQGDSLGFSSIASLLNPLEGRQSNAGFTKDSDPKVKVDVKPTRIQVKFGNLNIGKLSNLNIGQDSRTGREKPRTSTNWLPHLPGENELPLVGELKQEDNLGRNGWEKYTLSLQFDRETKRLWNELQRPYGNQSSFLRHLVMLEKYWRSGSLVLAENADPRAVKYNQRARTRVQAYESVSARPVSTFVVSSMTPVITATTTVASSLTVTSSLPATPLMTATSLPSASTSCSSLSLPSSPTVTRLPEIVQIVKPMTSASATATSKTDTPPSVHISTSPSSTITPPPPPPPLLKLDSSGVMWQKVQTNNQNTPMFAFQNSQFVRPIKVVVSSMSNSSSGKPVPNVISVLTSSAGSKTTPSSRPIKMTLQQFQSFQKRVKKDIKITPALNISPVVNKVPTSQYSSSSCSTTISASAALAAARAVTTVTTAVSTSVSTQSSSSSNVDTFIPLICDVRSLAGTNSSWSRSIKPAKGSKVTYYTPILPKLPNTVTVRQIVPPNTSVPLNSSVTIEKAPSDDSLSITSLVPEKPSISVFREDCSDSSV